MPPRCDSSPASTEPFRVGDLPGLRPEQQTDLARTLIVSGFLVRLPDGGADREQAECAALLGRRPRIVPGLVASTADRRDLSRRDMGSVVTTTSAETARNTSPPCSTARPPSTSCWGCFGRICRWYGWSGRTTKRSHTSTGVADGGFDVAGIGRDFADGYTIVLESIHRYVRAIASLLHAIEVELNFATQVNAYFTPPESQGFVAALRRARRADHADSGIQDLASVRRHRCRAASALRHEPVAADALPSPTDVRLEVGDVLYLPRGRVHAAEATSEVSVHLTVGVHAPTLLMLVTRALNSLSGSDDRVHTQLPPRYLDDPRRAGHAGRSCPRRRRSP